MPSVIPVGGSGLGKAFWTLGGPPLVTGWQNRSMPTAAKPLVAHVYDTNWGFLRTLKVLSRPMLKVDVNAGHQPMTLDLDQDYTSVISAGNLITLHEDGGDGDPIFGGVVEQFNTQLSPTSARYQVTVTPFVAELGDSYFNAVYSQPTDIADMLHDAVGNCAHVALNFWTCPQQTNILMTATFNNTTVLDAVNQIRQMAGENWYWYVDEVGRFWFQPMGSTPTNFYGYTFDGSFQDIEITPDTTHRKNHITIYGGNVPPIQGNYVGASTATLGTRRWDPPPTYPAITDQLTINAIASSLGGMFDRTLNTIKVTLPAYSQRITLGQQGGGMIRYKVPNDWPLTEASTGSGGYSAGYVALSVQTDGIQQTVTFGDLPYNAQDDYQYQVTRTLQRLATNPTLTSPNWNLGNAGGASFQNNPSNAYTDPNGVTSPAHTPRIIRSDGTLVADGMGLAQIANVLSSSTASSGTQVVTGANTWTDLTTGSYTLARRQSVMIIGILPANVTQNAGIVPLQLPCRLLGDGSTASSLGVLNNNLSTSAPPYTCSTLVQILNLSAGTYTAHFQWETGATNATYTLNYANYALYVIGLGS